MQQYSSLPKENSQVDVNPDNLLATLEQVEDQLWLESSLNQLWVCLNKCLESASEQEELIENFESQIYQILVNQLHKSFNASKHNMILRGSALAIALPQEGKDICKVCYLCAGSSHRSQHTSIEIILKTGQKLYLRLKEVIEVEDLHHLQAQQPPGAWSIADSQNNILGWLILSSIPLKSGQPPLNNSSLNLRTSLIDRAVKQCGSVLEQFYNLRASQLEVQNLKKFNRELKRTNELKKQFLANTSHEIRTPLSSIIGFTHLLLAQGYDSSRERHQEYLHIIQSSGKHLLALINDILDLSKIEANQLEVQWEKIDISQLCRNVLALVKEKAANKNLTLRLEIDDNVNHMVADPLRIKQMLLNLLFNALKFTNEGSVGLEVKSKADYIYFTVWDTGTGISPAHQAELFQPYCQIPNTAVNRDEGTGLGLALTRKLAEIHGGRVEVESELKKGSKFKIILPLNPISKISLEKEIGENSDLLSDSADGFKNDSSFSQVIDTNLHNENAFDEKYSPRTNSQDILLVEDDLHNAKLIETYLIREGYKVNCIHNATQMWDILASKRPNLILMDVSLPDANGLNLVKELRSHQQYQNIPIIAQTAMAMKGDRELCLTVGVDEYISKPIDLELLSQLVAKYIQ